MRTFVRLSAATLIAATLTACNSANREADIKAIHDLETQWSQEFGSKDVDKVLAHYADDAILMTPGVPLAKGKPAIHDAFKTMFADPSVSLNFTTSIVEVAQSGDLAWTQGPYTLTVTDPATKQVIHDHGSYVTTYRKQSDGSWKAVADIASSEVPPTPPAPAPTASPAKPGAKP